MTDRSKQQWANAMQGLVGCALFWLSLWGLNGQLFEGLRGLAERFGAWGKSMGLPSWLFFIQEKALASIHFNSLVYIICTLVPLAALVTFAVLLEDRRIEREFADGRASNKSKGPQAIRRMNHPPAITFWNLQTACVGFFLSCGLFFGACGLAESMFAENGRVNPRVIVCQFRQDQFTYDPAFWPATNKPPDHVKLPKRLPERVGSAP